MPKIRIGRRVYNNGIPCDPHLPNYTNIICMIKSSNNEYGVLSPYNLKTQPTKKYPNGIILENAWQFSKVY